MCNVCVCMCVCGVWCVCVCVVCVCMYVCVVCVCVCVCVCEMRTKFQSVTSKGAITKHKETNTKENSREKGCKAMD